MILLLTFWKTCFHVHLKAVSVSCSLGHSYRWVIHYLKVGCMRRQCWAQQGLTQSQKEMVPFPFDFSDCILAPTSWESPLWSHVNVWSLSSCWGHLLLLLCTFTTLSSLLSLSVDLPNYRLTSRRLSHWTPHISPPHRSVTLVYSQHALANKLIKSLIQSG